MFVVTLTYGCPPEIIDGLMPQHVAWFKKHYASGLFIASGRQVPRTGGVILARSGDRQELMALLEEDPFIAKGCARAEVVEFTPSMTAPGAEVLKKTVDSVSSGAAYAISTHHGDSSRRKAQ